jgi:hypothetical protein
VCAAIVVAGNTEGMRARWALRPRRVGIAAGAAAVVAIAIALPWRTHALEDERFELKGMSQDASTSNDVFFDRLRAAALAHPAEPYFPYLGAVRTWAFIPDRNIVPWIDRVLQRAAVYPPAHLLLARWLRPRSTGQALLEYRLASEQNGGQVAKEAEGLVRSYEDVVELTPDGKAGVDVLEGLAEHISSRLPATRAQIDAEITRRDPNAVGPGLRAANDALLDLRDGDAAPWCAERHENCARDAVVASYVAEQRAPDRCEPYRLEALLHIELGAKDEALDALAKGADRVTDRAACLRFLAEMAIDQNETARATDAIEKLANASCATEVECIQNLLSAGSLEQKRGNKSRALILFRRAADQAPERDDLVENVAAQARAAGLHAFASESYERLAARHPENGTYARLAKEEAEAARKR